MNKIVELFDWIITDKSVRGSKQNDNGIWLNNSMKPIYFYPSTRIIVVEDGSSFLIKKETICKAIGLDKKSEKVLNGLPLPLKMKNEKS
jgi:hypothetical protein